MGSSLADSSDDGLVQLGLEGSEDALVELYERYRKKIYGYIYRMTSDHNISDDVFHATFSYFFERLNLYVPSGKLGAYLFRIARSMLSDERTAAKRMRPDPDQANSLAAKWAYSNAPRSSATPDDIAHGEEVEQRVRDAVERLPDHMREVAVLRLYQGLNYGEVAEIVGVGVATARSRMRYAIQELREELAGLTM